MKKLTASLLVSCLLTVPAVTFAQWPAGTPESERGAMPSTQGNPAPQEEVETRVDSQGRTVIEDGREVRGAGEAAGQAEQGGRHSGDGGITDSSSDPGQIEGPAR
ncbi:hypothetical protein DN820_20295 [Stutzerimonas nosocomialis]|uniref:Phage infection protein n=1 Tax=Stutzerimonas nosocomialis TaxID=1056496 RepID=A0A5R9Q975_9GAMM|nr:hypothetical protein [Stutzerimonas nosocomialis]TLX61631.1 hypothetical protein DN820_20295 [Stutzerimonas nosocomialis]